MEGQGDEGEVETLIRHPGKPGGVPVQEEGIAGRMVPSLLPGEGDHPLREVHSHDPGAFFCKTKGEGPRAAGDVEDPGACGNLVCDDLPYILQKRIDEKAVEGAVVPAPVISSPTCGLIKHIHHPLSP